ncbi:hypothetical protein RFI_35955, partial [Reticulomyxa filosa]
ENMTNLSRAILSLYSNSQEFVDMLKKCCDVNLVQISSLVNEDDKVRTEKSLEQLKEAMVYGQWKFGVCEDILQGDKNNELTLKIIANTIWHYDEIGENIGRVLLGVDKKELKEIELVIKQFEECKEISTIRVEFWKQGGRSNDSNDKNEISVDSQTSDFTKCKELWNQRLMKWKQYSLRLREMFPALNFFCFNEIHSLIQQIETLLLPSCLDRSVQARKSIKPFLQKVNCQITDQDVDKILQDWGGLDMVVLTDHTYDTDNDEGFKKSGDAIAKFGLALHSLWTCSLHNRITKTYPTGLNAGKPSLILHPNNSLLFNVLGLFESQQCIPRAEHILICNENTTEEDVTYMHRDSVKPLYCLAYPENLTLSILDQVCQAVHDLLLNDVQLEKLKHCFYLFV